MYYVINSEVTFGKGFIFESDEDIKKIIGEYKEEHYDIVYRNQINENSEDPDFSEKCKQREREFFGGKSEKEYLINRFSNAKFVGECECEEN